MTITVGEFLPVIFVFVLKAAKVRREGTFHTVCVVGMHAGNETVPK